MNFSNEMLFDRKSVETFYGSPAEPRGKHYDDDRGFVVHAEIDGHIYHHDLIQFESDAMAFTGSGTPRPLPWVGHHRQVLEDGDWVHFSLRLGGSGSEAITDYTQIEQAGHSCMVTRYPAGSSIERISAPNQDWRTACLWLKPAAVLRFLETSAAHVPEKLSLLVDPGHIDTPRHFSLPLNRNMVDAVNDVLTCSHNGGARRAYVRSRYLDILTQVYQSALACPDEGDTVGQSLTPQVVAAVEEARLRLSQRLHHMGSLDALAREVGLSRSRLTQAFRARVGCSVEVYWQQLRMERAKSLLLQARSSVSGVAEELGYAEVASFSRAFTRCFGITPSQFRRS